MRVSPIIKLTSYRLQHTLLFLFFLVLLAMAFYLFGSQQGFLDENLILLMEIAMNAALAYMVVGAILVVFLLIETIQGGEFHAVRFAVATIGAVVVAIPYFLMHMILVWV